MTRFGPCGRKAALSATAILWLAQGGSGCARAPNGPKPRIAAMAAASEPRPSPHAIQAGQRPFDIDRSTLETWKSGEHGDPEGFRPKIRAHAWDLLFELNKNASENYRYPIWLTWRARPEVFNCDPPGRQDAGIRVEPDKTLGESNTKIDGQCAGDRPGNYSLAFYSPAAATVLNGWYCGANDRKHSLPRFEADTPTVAVVKPMWVLLPKGKSLCLPTWRPTIPPNNGTWDTPDLISVSENPRGLTQPCDYGIVRSGQHNDPNPPHPAVRADSFMLRDASGDVPRLRPDAGSSSDVPDQLREGKMLMIGLHIIVRELGTWSWNTYWWVPEEFRSGNRYTNDRPAVPAGGEYPSWLANFAMDSSLNASCDDKGDHQPCHPLFNFYLESQISDGPTPKLGGLASNCLSCHKLARNPPLQQVILIEDLRPEEIGKTVFLWSVPNAPRDVVSPDRTKVYVMK